MVSQDGASVEREVIDPDGDIVLRLYGSAYALAKKASRAGEAKKVSQAGEATTGRSPAKKRKLYDSEVVLTGYAPAPAPAPAPGTVELLVSSKILCLISPVFRTLLTGSFLEAAEFSGKLEQCQASGSMHGGCRSQAATGRWPRTEPYVLDLPDDDANAIAVIVNIAHFRPCHKFYHENGMSPTNVPSTRFLERLAYACDKYQCAAVLQTISETWLTKALAALKKARKVRPTKNDRPYMHGLSFLIVFAFVADRPSWFWKLCWEVVYHHVGPMSHWGLPITSTKGLGGGHVSMEMLSEHPLLPNDLTVILEAKRLEACNAVYKAMISPLKKKVFKGAFADSSTSFCCDEAAERLSTYMASALGARVLPRDLRFSDMSLKLIFTPGGNNKKYASLVQELRSHGDSCRERRSTPFKYSGFDIRGYVRAALKVQSVCMDCFVANKQEYEKGKCRIKHT